jgi:hypothetical protein
MRAVSWKDIIEFLGITAIVASLIFVGFQIQQDQEIAIADTYGSIPESAANLAELVMSESDVWRRGLDGEELPNEDQVKFLALLSAVQLHISNIHIRWNQIGPIASSVASRRYAFALYTYPGLRNARSLQLAELEAGGVALEGAFTSSLLEREADRFLADYDKSNPPMPQKKSYIFW